MDKSVGFNVCIDFLDVKGNPGVWFALGTDVSGKL
jgi:hypothetical protein